MRNIHKGQERPNIYLPSAGCANKEGKQTRQDTLPSGDSYGHRIHLISLHLFLFENKIIQTNIIA